MDISIEFVFLFACALFVLHFIINRCGYTNVEGFECGSCPWSTAKCPPECPATSTDKCGVWDMGTGAKYECTCKDANYAGGKPVCLDTGSTINLDIGILDLRLEAQEQGSISEKAYMWERQDDAPDSGKWVEYTTVLVDKPLFGDWKYKETNNIVTDQNKLDLLNKLKGDPYYIQNIGILSPNYDSVEVSVKTWNNDKGKHFYFSDRTGDAYCLSVTTDGGVKGDFPHSVKIGQPGNPSDSSWPAYIQYLGYKESNAPFC